MALLLRSSFVLASILLSVIILSPLTVFATNYTPGVAVGNSAEYKVRNVTWESNVPGLPEPQEFRDFEATERETIIVTDVTNTNVTALTTTYYNNGSTPRTSMVEGNVENMKGNLTYGIIATMLASPDRIWNTDSSPTLNRTEAKTVLGTSRMVNFLNQTMSFPYGTFALSFAWDQISGIIVESSFLEEFSSGPYSTHGSFTIAITSTNIWSSSPPPSADFILSSSSSVLTIQAGSSGTSTITLTSQNGYSGTVSLSEDSSLASLDHSSVSVSPGYPGIATLTITTATSTLAGSYTVTITGSDGSKSRTITVQVTVTAPSSSEAPTKPSTILGLQQPVFYGIVGVIVAVIVAGIGLAVRMRKPSPSPALPADPTHPNTA